LIQAQIVPNHDSQTSGTHLLDRPCMN
jgi:hypothetical protein